MTTGSQSMPQVLTAVESGDGGRPKLESLGIEPIRFHDLRHGNASFLLRAGTHPKVRERLRHSTIKLTMDRYSQLLPDGQDEAAGAFHRTRQAAKAADGDKMATELPVAGTIKTPESA